MTDSVTMADGEVEAARWAKELGKGATRLALLAVLDGGESYGYEILATLRSKGARAVGTTEAAIYPLLKDLESKGHLRSRWKSTEDGVPPRKYYALTPQGTKLLAALRQEWKAYLKEMRTILEDRS
jgi:PadR family transcriptional regulator PadR